MEPHFIEGQAFVNDDIYEVTARPNRRFPGYLLLTFVQPCYMCGRKHHHGGALNPDGTYGHRLPHCSTPKRGYPGRHERPYLLVPEEYQL